MDTETPLDQLGEQEHCLNCSAPRSEVYCQRCGQRHIERRLSMRSILRELPSRLFSLERGLLLTVLQSWRSPGKLARAYVHGKRARYVSPLTMFLIAATVQLVALALIAPTLKTSIAKSFEAQQIDVASRKAFDELEQSLGEGPAEKLAELWLTTMNHGYTYAALFFFCVPLAVLLSLAHRHGGSSYLLGENLVFAVYTVSQLLICTALANLITIHISSTVQMSVSFLLYFGYLIVAHRGFYPRGLSSLLRTLIAFVISVAVFVTSLLGIFAVAFAVEVVKMKSS